MFASEKERTALISRRFGGYWRYPGMLDFCYLVNSYYPPKKMLDEIRSNFDVLVRQYPSGMYVNSLLAARNFSLRQDQILTQVVTQFPQLGQISMICPKAYPKQLAQPAVFLPLPAQVFRRRNPHRSRSSKLTAAASTNAIILVTTLSYRSSQ